MRDMTAALIFERRRLLLVHNAKNGLRIEPPGGKVEGDESIISCVKRETREELGIGINPFSLSAVHNTRSPEGDFRVFMYLSYIISGRPRIMEPDKIPHYDWYDLNDLLGFRRQGILVPNLCSALDGLRPYLD